MQSGLADVNVPAGGLARPISAGSKSLVGLNILINAARATRGKGHVVILLNGDDRACRRLPRERGIGFPIELLEKALEARVEILGWYRSSSACAAGTREDGTAQLGAQGGNDQ